MTVYLVIDNEGNIEGIFSTQGKAVAYVRRTGPVTYPRKIFNMVIDAED